MKEPEITRKWIAAGKNLAADPTAQISCPVCDQETLVVTDVAIDGTKKFERIMRCENCSAWNVLLMSKKQ